MTLSEFRTDVKLAIHENGQSHLTDANLNSYINAAMHDVWHWLVAMRSAYCIHSEDITISNAGGDKLLIHGAIGSTYPRAFSLLGVTVTSSEQDCPIIEFSDYRSNMPSAQSSVPPAFLYGEGVGFLWPANSLGVTVYYYHGLTDMDQDTNTPGQSGVVPTGTANKIPVDLHPTIVYVAADLILRSENIQSPWSTWVTEKQRMLGAATPTRRISPIRR